MYVRQFDASGVPTYHACAAYRERSIEGVKNGKKFRQARVQKNVRALKAFWMDLDCGDGKGFSSQELAADGIVAFCNSTKLELPMVVSSGTGLHIYWALENEISPDQWKQTAEALKVLAAKLEFKADPACTADMARVLRSVGTFNRKESNNPRLVELIAEGSETPYADFRSLVLQALQSAGAKPPEIFKVRETETERLNESFAIQREFPPCSAKKVADRCAQLARMRDTKGCVPEPLWYAGIQLMCHAVEGDELIHEWSNGYAGYSIEETERKITQIRSQALGPTLCRTFESRNPTGCDSCPFRGEISSPAQLGAEIESAPPPTVILPSLIDGTPIEVTLPPCPAPFTRKAEEKGIYVEEDGILHKIYEYDCYPIDLIFDESIGHEVVRLRHWLPKEGWHEVVVQSSLIAKPAEFEVALRDHGIQPLIRNRFILYMDSYIRQLRATNRTRRLFRSMGWKENGESFVLGDRLYQRNGEIIQSGFSHQSAGFLSSFQTKGNLERWRALTEVFKLPGVEAQAFMLLLAFAAPLLELAGLEGFTVSALGETGTGKTTMGKFLASVYGHPKDTWISRIATANARVERLGAYNSIPAYMDEITTIEPKEIREIIYMIPTGKAKEALTRTRVARDSAKWQTILIVSTNDSLQAKLTLEKANPEAESMRLFEFTMPYSQDFNDIAKAFIHPELALNYGVAGAEFIRRLVMEQDMIQPQVLRAIAAVEAEFGMLDQERFWSRAAGLTLFAGKLAKEWGLVDFNPESIRPWLFKETKTMRANLEENRFTAAGVLAEYLDQNVGERIVVSKLNASMVATNVRPTRGSLTQRYEKDTETLWVSSHHIKTWMERKRYNYTAVRAELMAKGVILNPRHFKGLGSGTDIKGGQVHCWKIQADHPELVGILND